VLTILFLGGLIIFSSCSKLPVYQSKWTDDSSDQEFSYYDTKSKIKYGVFNDHENLYVSLETEDKGAIMKILRKGLKLYMDPSGKKKQGIYLSFPLEAEGGKQAMNPSEMGMGQGNKSSKQKSGKKLEVSKLIQRTSKEGLFQNGDVVETVGMAFQKNDINIKLAPTKNNGLSYQVAIPLQKIFGDNEVSEKVSIGIETEALDMQNGMSGGRSGGMGGGRSGGMGGGRSGGMGGGRSGGMGGGRSGGMRGQNQQSMKEPISIWFVADLAQKQDTFSKKD
ncbi:hypothetical protein, partial [Xanthovirga aplysinae]|uniref:hypothetical protein n=1 Tax=Xanthovirga aplysinae TaxID=2529853 RepID=UPI001CA3C699